MSSSLSAVSGDAALDLDSIGPEGPKKTGATRVPQLGDAVASPGESLDKLGPEVKGGQPTPPKEPQLANVIEHKREDKRGQIATALVWGIALLVVFTFLAFIAIMWSSPVPLEKDPDLKLTIALAQLRQGGLISLLQLTLTPLVGLVGTMLGFYFGGRDAPPKPPSAT